MKTDNTLYIILTLIAILMTSNNNISAASYRETTLKSSSDSLPLSVIVATPDNIESAVGIVQIVHGMCEHKERYLPFIEFLNNNGYICIIHDHRGHGKSILSTDDLGYFYSGGYQAMIDDAYQVGSMIREQYPNLPFFLFGHSMGSMVVRSYAKRYDNVLSGLIVCGSPSYNASSSIGAKIAASASRRYGDHYRSEKIERMAFGTFNKRFADEGYSSAWVCSDPEVVRTYHADPLCGYIFTANGFENLFLLMGDAYRKKGWKLAHKDMPIWFISGTDDPCLGTEKKFHKAVKRMRTVGYTNVTAHLYPNMRHEILNERGKQMVWVDVVNTLNHWCKDINK